MTGQAREEEEEEDEDQKQRRRREVEVKEIVTNLDPYTVYVRSEMD